MAEQLLLYRHLKNEVSFFDKAHFTGNQNKTGECPYCDLRQANGTVK